jgi:hypothetical protein
MPTTISPEELFFGAPVSLTYGGTEVGGTVDAPKVQITTTIYTPEFQNAKGPIEGTDIVTKVIVAAEFTVNQFTAEKLAWAMPGSTTTGDTTTWEPGRIPTSAYKTLVLQGEGLDGRAMILSIYNAINVSPLEIDFSNQAIAGLKMRFEGRYDATTPTIAPFALELDLGS